VIDKTDIEYLCKNYLTIDYTEQFDVVTLIYCDYAALSVTDRSILRGKVHSALKPGGKFIFDVFTPRMRAMESRTWFYSDQGGFYIDKPHLCLQSVYQYDDEDRTELRQAIVITDESVKCYNVWDHFFSKDEIIYEVMSAGFSEYAVYGDIAGKEYSDESDTICCVLTK
jgi:SAM-dependent methyltransferase